MKIYDIFYPNEIMNYSSINHKVCGKSCQSDDYFHSKDGGRGVWIHKHIVHELSSLLRGSLVKLEKIDINIFFIFFPKDREFSSIIVKKIHQYSFINSDFI